MTGKEQLEALETLLASADICISIKYHKPDCGSVRPVVYIYDSSGFVWGRGYSLESAVKNIDINRVKSALLPAVMKGRQVDFKDEI